MDLCNVPGRVFLDTCVVNFILDHGEEIHDGSTPSADATERELRDISALRRLLQLGQRAMWQLAISPFTYAEVIGTTDPGRRSQLENWFSDIWGYWQGVLEQNDDLPGLVQAERKRVELLASKSLEALTDIEDRILICDAVVYRCDLFCTRDWSTILSKRQSLGPLPLSIVSPVEWWDRIKPFAGLWE